MSGLCSMDMCCGCGACALSCSQSCISLVENDEGFLYPQIDSEKCTNCGLCQRICPVNNSMNVNQRSTDAFAVFNSDKDIRINSSSGGVFSAFAKNILFEKGIVYGASFDKKHKVSHMRISEVEELRYLYGSKYVQSNMGDTFNKVKSDLDIGRKVLFSGTPCQVAGLKRFLVKEYDNLFTVDIVCHGVPSPMVWEKYLEYREKKDGAKPLKVCFRDKKYGWNYSAIRFKYENRKDYFSLQWNDPYMISFLKNLDLRSSCYICSFKGVNRISDVTLGDLWGAQAISPSIFNRHGTSIVLLHSDKAKEVFPLLTDLRYEKISTEEAIRFNTMIEESVEINSERENFIKTVKTYGFSKKTSHYYHVSLIRRIKRKIMAIQNYNR